MKIALICAMEEEIAPLRKKATILKKTVIGKTIIEEVQLDGLNQHELILVESGIGKVNAAVAATIVIERYQPDLLINSGSAGAFDTQLQVGDVVIPTSYTYGDVDATCFGYVRGQVPQMPSGYVIDADRLNEVRLIYDQSKNEINYAVDFGLALTLDSFMSDDEKVADIYRNFPATKVSDMEGLAIIQAADQYGIPVIAVKAVSDIVGHGQESADSFDNNLWFAAERSIHFTELLLYKLSS